MKKLGKHPTDAQLHAVRIAAKRSRYAAEAVAPVIGKPAQRYAETVAELQTVLGEYNDSIVTTAWLRNEAADLEAGTAFLAGALSEKEKVAGHKQRSAWRRVWKRLSQKKLHSWMEK